MSSSQLVEKYAPQAGGFTCAWIFYHWFPFFQLPTSTKDLLVSALTISSMAVGFLTTAKAILISINDKEIIKNLLKLNYYVVLVDYFLSAIHWSLGVAVISTLLILVDFTHLDSTTHLLFSIFIFVSVTAAFANYRIIRIFGRLLRAK